MLKKCPHCKSKKGFKVFYTISGNGYEIRNFNGKVIDCERNTYDKIDHYVECISCEKYINSDNVKID